jgi:mannose-6-phosphate isomerase-like protein (cupin superfamily)
VQVPGHRRRVRRLVLCDGGLCADRRWPAPHIHHNEDETFYVVEGDCTIRIGDETVIAGPGDFVNVPRGTVHCFRNDGDVPVRMILTFPPSGMEGFFEETLERTFNPTGDPPDDIDAIVARYVEAAPRYGLEFVEE